MQDNIMHIVNNKLTRGGR